MTLQGFTERALTGVLGHDGSLVLFPLTRLTCAA